METERIEYFLEYIANSLHRIAYGIDELVVLNKPQAYVVPTKVNDMPFPWGDKRIPLRIKNLHNWEGKRPTTFQQLIEVGRSTIGIRSKTRNIGRKSVESLDDIFEANGLGKEWMAS